MKNMASILMLSLLINGCARDLSSSVYTSDATLSFTLEGKIIAVREVTIKEGESLADNAGGMLAGGALGAAVGSTSSSNRAPAMVGAGIAGAVAGAVVQNALSKSQGYEYIVQVDTSKIKDGYYEGNAAIRNVISTARASGLITVIQSKENPIKEGQKVFVIFSNNRTRVVPAA